MKSVNIKLNLMTDGAKFVQIVGCLLYTSPSPRD